MRILIVALACMLSQVTFGQLAVDTTVTAEDLVEDFLLGSGVLISNVEVYGTNEQNGAFTGGLNVVGLYAGVVLSSAQAQNIDGSSNTDIGYAEGLPTSPYFDDLLEVANDVPVLIGQSFNINSINEVSMIEFDFIPYGDSLSFTYVFGSDEYLEWVNSSFNDAFAFFVSGPGINGPYTNNSVNIAYVPETDPPLPITVSSVNDDINSAYYVDNMENVGIAIDGYTVPLTASISGLEVGETYHIALLVGDGSDSALESIVLLEAGSFSSNVPVEPGDPGDFNADGVLDVNDLLLLIANYGCEGVECVGDINGDGLVNILDILAFLGLFN